MINIVLYEPEISPNTANIIRTCFSTNTKLHIIRPIAFDLHPHWMKRAAAGRFLSDIDHEIHNSYNDFVKKYGNKNIYYITRYGLKTYTDINFKKEVKQSSEIWLMFGTESTGIPKKILQTNINNCLRIPMTASARSINLANSVIVILYEVLRQLDFANLSKFEVQKTKNYLLKED
ncbi:tRNA (cytidine(34)-2'-O)-methyltransferase [Mycoplasma miroungirhinis]|uniref:Putative tRNA (cytidine(34)-2'-O)-methyltransferase n=1 Tax=Mycoplasma miroungirhinis TaxID=754516 RepID=A0A6M4JHV0_9MOLU|nr:tRNA (cytidine(34)-2'-O)-methyltransferase [Mycoplasma miroungirhinis]QJR44001.1 tRNA (cytidine(34)-2'-O)-methyltransferase [Mycoplasma miroungirhinis]